MYEEAVGLATTEERLDALEKLTQALSGALEAQTPASYYTSRYSGEELDELLDYVAGQKKTT